MEPQNISNESRSTPTPNAKRRLGEVYVFERKSYPTGVTRTSAKFRDDQWRYQFCTQVNEDVYTRNVAYYIQRGAASRGWHTPIIRRYANIPISLNGNQHEGEITTTTATTASPRPALNNSQVDHPIPYRACVIRTIASRHTDFHSVLHRRMTADEHDFRYDVEVFRACEGACFVCGFFEREHEA